MAIKKISSGQFNNFISTVAKKRNFPLRAMFELTYRCNFRCCHCYVVRDRGRKELNTEEVMRILDELKKAGCFHIGFTGGEPLARRDIFDILDYAHLSGFRISLLTNGSLIDETAARKIAGLCASLNRVDISVMAAARHTFEKIVRRRGFFEKVLKAIELLRKEGAHVQIKATAIKDNWHEIDMIRKLAAKHNAMFRFSVIIRPRINGHEGPLKYRLSAEEACELTQPEHVNLRTLKIGREKLFNCEAGNSEVVISPYGEMNTCLDIRYPAYDILRGNFQEGWNKVKRFVKNFKVPKNYKCDSCVLAQFCSWCPARLRLSSEDFSGCSGYDRDLALARFRKSR